ncbi:hypothetical protein D3C80_1389870 [compost metagenome]
MPGTVKGRNGIEMAAVPEISHVVILHHIYIVFAGQPGYRLAFLFRVRGSKRIMVSRHRIEKLYSPCAEMLLQQLQINPVPGAGNTTDLDPLRFQKSQVNIITWLFHKHRLFSVRKRHLREYDQRLLHPRGNVDPLGCGKYLGVRQMRHQRSPQGCQPLCLPIGEQMVFIGVNRFVQTVLKIQIREHIQVWGSRSEINDSVRCLHVALPRLLYDIIAALRNGINRMLVL